MPNNTLRRALVDLLTRPQAHALPEQAFADVRPELRRIRPAGSPHSLWELLEHMRLAQHDILRYATDPAWVSPAFPEGYWPDSAAPAGEHAWEKAWAEFESDLQAVVALVENPDVDLGASLPHAPQHTYLRQVLLVADHNAYHAGQAVQIRQTLGDWPGK